MNWLETINEFACKFHLEMGEQPIQVMLSVKALKELSNESRISSRSLEFWKSTPPPVINRIGTSAGMLDVFVRKYPEPFETIEIIGETRSVMYDVFGIEDERQQRTIKGPFTVFVPFEATVGMIPQRITGEFEIISPSLGEVKFTTLEYKAVEPIKVIGRFEPTEL